MRPSLENKALRIMSFLVQALASGAVTISSIQPELGVKLRTPSLPTINVTIHLQMELQIRQ